MTEVIIYAIFMGWMNHIRGGMFKVYVWNNTLGWKIIAAIGVALATHALLKDADLVDSFILGALWFFALLPTWGAWIDAGKNAPDYARGGALRSTYIFLGKLIDDQRKLDFAMLAIRALMFLPMFAYITFDAHPFYVTALVLPCAILWAASYDICGNVFNKPDLSEYVSGFVIGLFLALGYITTMPNPPA